MKHCDGWKYNTYMYNKIMTQKQHISTSGFIYKLSFLSNFYVMFMSIFM